MRALNPTPTLTLPLLVPFRANERENTGFIAVQGGGKKLDSSPFKEEIRWGMGLWVEAETKRLEAAGGQEGDGIKGEI